MNPKEELLTNWWSEFIVKDRGYAILIRNLTVDKFEYDAVGVYLDGSQLSTMPRLENIETKLAKPESISRAARKLTDQLERHIKHAAFHGYIGLCNMGKALSRLPRQAGSGVITLPTSSSPAVGRMIAPPAQLPVRQIRYEPVRNAIRQLYSAAMAIGLPCIFAKCQRRDCRYYYGFNVNHPLPEMTSVDSHSAYCPQSENVCRGFAFVSKGFQTGGITFQLVRESRPI